MKSVITCDMEGVIETMNNDAEQIFGYTKDEMKYLTPQQANEIIKNKITSLNSTDRGRNQ